jgi:hypothetical protein
MTLIYGFRIESDDDEYLKITDMLNYGFSHCGSPGNTAVDILPFCKVPKNNSYRVLSHINPIVKYMPDWFPGTYYARFAREQRPMVDEIHDKPIKRCRQELVFICYVGYSKSILMLYNRPLEVSNLRSLDIFLMS